MFGTLGGPEVVLILVVALIIFGPRKLPEIGRTMGRMMAEFRKASNEFQRTIHDEVEADKAREDAAARTPDAPAPTAIRPETHVDPAEGPASDVPPELRVAAPDAPIVSRGAAPPSSEPQ